MTQFDWLALPLLTTDRLVLRSLLPSDKSDLFKIYGDPEVMRFASDPAFSDESVIDQLLDSVNHLFKTHESLEWGIVLAQDDRVVGTCGFHSFERSQAEIGCLLAKADWGQGLMTEALKRILEFGATELGLDTIVADIDPENQRSLALFDRLGFIDGRLTL